MDSTPPVSLSGDAAAVARLEESLPEQLPPDPFPLFKAWFDEAAAKRVQPNPNAFTLATIDPDGKPSARIVLCKSLAVREGYIVFYTNRRSRKGAALAANPRAAAVFHWDALDRQVRIEGPVVESPDEESDAYFHSRPVAARIGAWASDQSQPIESRDAFIRKIAEAIRKLGVAIDDEAAHVPRPPYWGGYRIWADTVELWLGSPVRVHDRARWTRKLTRQAVSDPRRSGFEASAWTAQRLQP